MSSVYAITYIICYEQCAAWMCRASTPKSRHYQEQCALYTSSLREDTSYEMVSLTSQLAGSLQRHHLIQYVLDRTALHLGCYRQNILREELLVDGCTPCTSACTCILPVCMCSTGGHTSREDTILYMQNMYYQCTHHAVCCWSLLIMMIMKRRCYCW